MVLNGLGFVGQRLYLPDFFKNDSTERFFGNSVTREDLNQYAIGETLDRIVKYGSTKLFTKITLHIMTRLHIPVNCLHADTTSVRVYGDYDTDNNIKNIGKSFWISRVPATITEAKELLTANLNLKTLKSDERYSFYQTFVEYGVVKQKWVLLPSHKMKEKKEETLRTKLEKEVEKTEKAVKKLKGEDLFCEEDAVSAYQ